MAKYYRCKRPNGPVFSMKEHAHLFAKAQAEESEEKTSAINQLILLNMRLVGWIAERYIRNLNDESLTFDDLVQEGSIGLHKAVQKFDMNTGHAFSTYASFWIRQSISRFIHNKYRDIRLPVHLFSGIGIMLSKEQLLSHQLNRPPTMLELAEAIGTEEETVAIMHYSHYIIKNSIDKSLNPSDQSESLLDIIPNPKNKAIDEVIDFQELSQELRSIVNSLPKKEKIVIERRYGFRDGSFCTLQEISEELNMTRERVRQIEAKVIKRFQRSPRIKALREYLKGL